MDFSTHREGVGSNAGLEEGRDGEKEGQNKRPKAACNGIEMEVADDGNGGGRVQEGDTMDKDSPKEWVRVGNPGEDN